MRDQISAAAKSGLRAASINSTNAGDWDAVFDDIAADRLDVLLVSPERLGHAGFARRLPGLVAAAGLVVIDEAHCISDWGFDFRPDYQRLAKTLVGISADTPVLATTATANQRVTSDIARQLGPHPRTLRGSLARSSLRLAVVPGLTSLQRHAWVADALDEFAGSGIVYALTVAETWFDASKYFLGDMFDSTMNYVFRNAVLAYAAGGPAADLVRTRCAATR